MKLLTIITPTFNREKLLKKCYDSLKKQTLSDFTWLIIDDGSMDKTKTLVKNWINKNEISIEYIYRKNGGKHRALNVAFEKLNSELAIILDSDDYLIPDAIKIIKNINDKYRNDVNICGYCFLKGKNNKNSVTLEFREKEFEDNYNEYIINGNLKGDKAEVFKSKILKKFRFDEFKGEKFLGEGYLWSRISNDYNMIFINKIIYVCDYLDKGLTKLGRKLRINNPRGGMRHAKEYIDKKYNFKIRVKNILLYLTYSKFLNIKFKYVIAKTPYNHILFIILNPCSEVLYLYWKNKYLKRGIK